MINKIYKTIHNKYLKFFRFIFFLRYLLLIFLISTTLFLIIPSYFNYEKHAEVVKTYLITNYKLEIIKYEKIKFQVLPLPNLELKNVEFNLKSPQIKLVTNNFKIYPKFLSIYNFNNFQVNKIVLKKNNISLNSSNLKFFLKHIINQKKKLLIDGLDLNINNKEKTIIKLKNTRFSNYGYNKNLITGEFLGKKFKTKLNKDLNNLSFKLLNTGISADINFEKNEKNNLLFGSFKSKILKNNLKFNFKYDYKKLDIFDSYFRSKNLSFNNESSLILTPYFSIDSKFNIQDLNYRIFENIDINKTLNAKSVIKKINTDTEIFFKSKKISRHLIDELNLKINMAFGRMNYIKNISISGHHFKCKGNINLLEEYPILFFDCFIDSYDKQKLLREFFIKTKGKKENFRLNVSGNLNILNKKINFKKINMNENYVASKEDLNYFKDTFERIIFDENFIKIFNLKKIKAFILDIS